MKSKIIFLGGFLGAGKTTLLENISSKLSKNGKKIGLISNDQTHELVDTAFFIKSGIELDRKTTEVFGSCFCCNFNGLIKAIEYLCDDKKPDFIFAEPVGSCADLSATIIQPLKDLYSDRFDIAPLSVLVDPKRLADILYNRDYDMDKNAQYILVKQLEEADFILINKIDLLDESEIQSLVKKTLEKFNAEVFTTSGTNGENLDEWFNSCITSSDIGKNILDIDYDKYADGEAILGWCNAKVELTTINEEFDWLPYINKILNYTNNIFKNNPIGHIKLILESEDDYILGNITGTDKNPYIRGNIKKSKKCIMTINARVEMHELELEKEIKNILSLDFGFGTECNILAFDCLQPGRPNPTYRYEKSI
ncbi:MAG: GTP-binding protein [Lachnospirales bacterium]